MTEKLFGFIGLGNMGAGMARNIAAKGHAMIVHDLAGIRVAIALHLIADNSPITEDQRFLLEVVNSVSWAIVYGVLGMLWGYLRFRFGEGQKIK